MSGVLNQSMGMRSQTLSGFNIKSPYAHVNKQSYGRFSYDSGFRDLEGYQPIPWGVSGVTTQRGHYHRIGTVVWYDCTCHCESQADETKMYFEIPFRITDDSSYQPTVGISHAQDSDGVQDFGNLSANHAMGQIPHYYDYTVKFNSSGSGTGWNSSGSRTFYWAICYEAFWPLQINTGGQSTEGGTTVGFTSSSVWAY